jgi:predicted amidohydrolase
VRHTFTLAAAQSIPVAGDVEANVAAHLALLHAAAAVGAELLVFPELSLTGYELARAPALAFEPEDARLRPLREAAAGQGVSLVVGAPVRLDDRLHLGAFLLLRDGGIDLYTKRHLGAFSEDARVDGDVPPPENAFFAPGERDPLLAIGDARAAVAICADTGRPAHSRAAAARGAAAYLASMFVIPSALEADHANLEGIAARHAMHVVFANYGGPTGGLASGGGSAIWAAGGERLAQLGPNGSGVVVAEWKEGSARGVALRV